MKPVARVPVRQFVRDVLGCSCPEAVFETVRVDENPQPFASGPASYLLRIGGRLQVLVIEVAGADAASFNPVPLLERGRQLRDAEGFNRFRLVIATPAADMVQHVLLEHFNAVAGGDERLHLHVVLPEQVPDSWTDRSLDDVER